MKFKKEKITEQLGKAGEAYKKRNNFDTFK